MASLFLCIILYLYIQSYIILRSCFSMRFRVAFRCRKWNRFEERKARRELRTAGEHFRRAGKRNLPLAIHGGNNILVTFHLHTLHPYFSPTVFLSGEVSFPGAHWNSLARIHGYNFYSRKYAIFVHVVCS